jgi:hypothetical protein
MLVEKSANPFLHIFVILTYIRIRLPFRSQSMPFGLLTDYLRTDSYLAFRDSLDNKGVCHCRPQWDDLPEIIT